MEKYTAYTLNAAKEQGLSADEIAKQTEQLKQYSDMYKNPLFVVLLTYMEILPVGLLVSLIASLIIKRKTAAPQPGKAYASGAA